MIGQLRGVILSKQPPQLVVDVNGVGYEIDAPMSTFYCLPEVNQQVVLFTHFVVREDAQQLYGFYTQAEKALFRALLKINGIGPRLALTILSSIETDEFVRCVANHDAASLVRLPGVGKKTAERLILEMRDKLGSFQEISSLAMNVNIQSGHGGRNQVVQDVIAALIALGYKPQEAHRVVSKIDDGLLNSEDMIRKALRERIA